MDLFTLFLLAVGLSMDAFAVSICKGLAMKKNQRKTGRYCRSLVWCFSGTHADYRLLNRYYFCIRSQYHC